MFSREVHKEVKAVLPLGAPQPSHPYSPLESLKLHSCSPTILRGITKCDLCNSQLKTRRLNFAVMKHERRTQIKFPGPVQSQSHKLISCKFGAICETLKMMCNSFPRKLQEVLPNKMEGRRSAVALIHFVFVFHQN